MKTFKQLFTEGFISMHRGMKLFPTTHSAQRELERHVPREVLTKIHKKVVDKIANKEYNPPHGSSFMVFDKEHKQTVIFDHRRDKYAPKDKRNHLFIVSNYNPGNVGKNRPGQEHLTVEELEK